MDILRILKESASVLIPEDLDFFETELATGGPYDDDYQVQCKIEITRIRKWMNGEGSSEEGSSEPKSQPDSVSAADDNKKIVSKGVVLETVDIIPCGAEDKSGGLSTVERVVADIKSLRSRSNYRTAFKTYVKNSSVINADFLDKNFSVLESWEMDAIASVKQLGEDFLEKYFDAIDHEKIARYQLFSEGFFMKHFAQMDASIVLEHGKNEWRKKENRSKQLDVFLRLKGVKI